jgi:hypothetical protein
VGGNTLIPSVREEAQRVFQAPVGGAASRLVILETEETMEAVARGTVLIPDARLDNALPYPLSLWLLREGQEPQRLWSKAASTALIPEVRTRVLQFGYANLRVRLQTTIGERDAVLVEETIAMPTPEARTCHLRYEVRTDNGGPRLEASYCIDPVGSQKPTERLFSYEI